LEFFNNPSIIFDAHYAKFKQDRLSHDILLATGNTALMHRPPRIKHLQRVFILEKVRKQIRKEETE
jgi:hypothetical protein